MDMQQATKEAIELKSARPGCVVSVVEREGVYMVLCRTTRHTFNSYMRKGWQGYELVGCSLHKTALPANYR